MAGSSATNADLDHSIAELGIGDEFPGMPQSFATFLQINPAEEGAFERYLLCLKSEPGIAAKVLKVANSAFMGGASEITNLRTALVRLGTTATHSVIMSVLVMDVMKDSVGLLTHSVATGVFASRVAAAADLGNPDDAFAAGMLHDIGKIFLMLVHRKRGDRGHMAPGCGDNGLEAERAEFGVDHTQVGCWLATRWNFPESLRRVIRDHHAPPADASLATRLVGKANEWTRSYYQTTVDKAPDTEHIIGWIERNLNLARPRFLEVIQHVPGDVAALVDHFVERPVGSQEVLRLLQRANIALGEMNFRHEFLHRRMTRQLRNLTLLQGLNSEVSACVGQRAMCDKVVELISARLQLGVVSILLPAPGGRLFVQSAVGLPKEIVGDPNATCEGSIGRWVFEHGHP
ncbi:MAG: HDOD domain-containing protein, partial [Candidatus Hydrogenedentes bacterium]|nr:HDOD domain-containing protein [Candidatus Hydrogenedentota bacterium]